MNESRLYQSYNRHLKPGIYESLTREKITKLGFSQFPIFGGKVMRKDILVKQFRHAQIFTEPRLGKD